MSGQEIVSIHLGPYANYVAAHTWNLDYTRVFGSPIASVTQSSRDSDSACQQGNDDTSQHCSPHILFRKSRGSGSGAGAYTPRAVFCDHVGSVPTAPLSVLVEQEKARARTSAHAASASGDPLHYSWGGSTSGFGEFAPSTASTSAAAAVQDAVLPGSTWHDVLLPSLRPRPRSLCLAPAAHQLPSSCEHYVQGASLAAMASASVVSAGGAHGSYLESILEAFRWHAEDCDSLQGIRLFADCDSAWAGLAARVIESIRDSFPATPVIFFATAPPLGLFDPAPRWLSPALWCLDEAAPASVHAFIAPTDAGAAAAAGDAASAGRLTLSAAAARLTPASVAAAHGRRASSLALLLAHAATDASRLLVIPLAVPLDRNMVAEYAALHGPQQFAALDTAADAADAAAAGAAAAAISGAGAAAASAASAAAAAAALSPTQRALIQLARWHPSAAFAVLSSAALALAAHTFLAPTYTRGGGLTFHTLVATLVARPALTVGGLALAVAPRGPQVLSRSLFGSKRDGRRGDTRVAGGGSGGGSNSGDGYGTYDAGDSQYASVAARLFHTAGLRIFSPLVPASAADARRVAALPGSVGRDLADRAAAAAARASAASGGAGASVGTGTVTSAAGVLVPPAWGVRAAAREPLLPLSKLSGFAVLAGSEELARAVVSAYGSTDVAKSGAGGGAAAAPGVGARLRHTTITAGGNGGGDDADEESAYDAAWEAEEHWPLRSTAAAAGATDGAAAANGAAGADSDDADALLDCENDIRRKFLTFMSTLGAGSFDRNSSVAILEGSAVLPPAFPLPPPVLRRECAGLSAAALARNNNSARNNSSVRADDGETGFSDIEFFKNAGSFAQSAGLSAKSLYFYDATRGAAAGRLCFAPKANAIAVAPTIVDGFVAADFAGGFAASAERLKNAWRVPSIKVSCVREGFEADDIEDAVAKLQGLTDEYLA